ncbi:MAG: hypothetical protein ABIQ32_02975 [Sphingomicrobium sp.]
MTRTLLTLTLAASAALAGCNKSDQAAANAAEANNLAEAAPVVLPPSITASKSYRCKDNSVVYIDWMSDGSARAKKTRDAVGDAVTAIPTGSADLTGDSKASTITYKGQSCKA